MSIKFSNSLQSFTEHSDIFGSLEGPGSINGFLSTCVVPWMNTITWTLSTTSLYCMYTHSTSHFGFTTIVWQGNGEEVDDSLSLIFDTLMRWGETGEVQRPCWVFEMSCYKIMKHVFLLHIHTIACSCKPDDERFCHDGCLSLEVLRSVIRQETRHERSNTFHLFTICKCNRCNFSIIQRAS